MTTILFSAQSLFSMLILLCTANLATAATATTDLPPDEVEALKEIADTLGKRDWDFDTDPCNKTGNWSDNLPLEDTTNDVNCSCTSAGADNTITVCHVTSIVLKSQSLPGTLPRRLFRLPYLQNFDVTRNCLNGTIPKEWGSTKLVNISVLGNRLTGPIPKELGNISTLSRLVVEINQLSGHLPPDLGNLSQLRVLHLTSNNFSGMLPSRFAELTALQELNLFASSAVDNGTSYRATSGLVACLRSQHCPKDWYSLSINCGGKKVKIRGITYSDDTALTTASSFYLSGDNWASSSTGHSLDDGQDSDTYIADSVSVLSMENAQLYRNARLSPISLTYYGFCLMNGAYNVRLHFAEIIFTGNESYTSLGRRAFNVYIQGKLVWEDFNIEIEAGGVGKPVIKKFNATVTDGTLEIRFYWAGKGTYAIPTRGVYGPLISAISVHPGFDPPGSISPGTVVGIVAAIVFVVFLILVILWWRGCLGREDKMARELKGLALQIGSFTLRQIKAATNNFDAANKIGEGGFGSVYKGLLSDGTTIAVKQLSSKSKQGNREFVTEIGMISALQHPHLVKLYGCCIEGNQLLLIYEYMENNNLARALFGPEEFQLKLDWWTRHKICVGIARGLAYLHEESRLKIVHRDIKATNVLLDKDLNPKISDFGLAKLDEDDKTHISTKIAGTYGYMAPEYAMHGYLTDKADIYSFGVVALEVVSGRSNTISQKKEECFYLLDWARFLKERGNLIELVDRRLGSHFDKEEALALIKVALMCTNATPALRPPMSSVVSMLEGRVAVPVLDSEGAIMTEEKIEAIRKHSRGEEHQAGSENITKSMSTEGPWTGTASSASANDLYPILLDTDYWQKRE
ncbi:hypothetical protein BT93_C0500 [Corymbia citriodora subsp. variegata]|nr:hypothetical protein BT93_C0500 [Corymbia citriodora subsp. variegata]